MKLLTDTRKLVTREATFAYKHGVMTVRVKKGPGRTDKVTVSPAPLDNQPDKLLVVQGWLRMSAEGKNLPATIPALFSKPELAAKLVDAILERIQETSQ